MLVMNLNSGDMIDLGGVATIRVSFDPQGRSRIRLSIDGSVAPIKRIKKQDIDTGGVVSMPLVASNTSVYKPEE